MRVGSRRGVEVLGPKRVEVTGTPRGGGAFDAESVCVCGEVRGDMKLNAGNYLWS